MRLLTKCKFTPLGFETVYLFFSSLANFSVNLPRWGLKPVIMGSLLDFLWSFIALFISCVFAILYQALKGKKGESLPFIPFLTVGTIASLICMSL